MQLTNRKNLVQHLVTLVGSVQMVYKDKIFRYSEIRKSFIYTAFPQQCLYFLPEPQGLAKYRFHCIL